LPTIIVVLGGVTAMELRVADVTVNNAAPVWPLSVAVIVAVPGVRALARPWIPGELLMVATFVSEDDHVAVVVTSLFVPSKYIAVAVNC